MNATDSLALTVTWFPNRGEENMPAMGDPENTTGDFVGSFWYRREEDAKDGACFVPARFQCHPKARRVRRLKANLAARTAVALDIEADKKTGEVPPELGVATGRATARGWAVLGYTSHSHRPDNLRYRIVLPLSAEIHHELPAVEIVADALGLGGVMDKSKRGASSLFYAPSSPYGALDLHQTVILPGAPIDAAWITEAAGRVLAARQGEADRVAEAAHAEAAARREAKIAAGFDPDDLLIEKLRSRFDLDAVLLSRGYDKAGTKYRHANSESGSYGADIKVFGGIERIFSHNGTDPLHADNLPAWCDVTAIDVFDVVTILDFGGDRKKAMTQLAERFGLTKAAERKALAGLMFRMIRLQATQDEIEAAAFAEGVRLGLSRQEVCAVAAWVVRQSTAIREAA